MQAQTTAPDADAPRAPVAPQTPAPQPAPKRSPASLLRWTGGVLCAVGAASFMMQGLTVTSAVARLAAFLAVAVGLGVAGVAMRRGAPHGARTFLGLAAASLPVIASQLGAMIYAFFGGQESALMPAGLVTAAVSPLTIAAATAGLAVVMVPIVTLAFQVLARSQAKPLTAAYLAATAAILVPLRGGAPVAAMLALVGVGLAWLLRRVDGDARLQTREALGVKGMLAVPFLVIAVRAWFYPDATLPLATLAGAVGAALLYAPRLPDAWNAALRMAGAFAVTTAAVVVVDHFLPPWAPEIRLLPEAVVAGVSFALGAHRQSAAGATRLRNLAAMLPVAAGVYAQALSPQVAVASYQLLVGALAITFGVLHGRKSPVQVGAFSVAAGLVYHGYCLGQAWHGSPWTWLVASGVVVLGAASLMEWRDGMLKQRLLVARKRWASFQ
jgi:hypothetical protein